jgi:hypothetical protein
MAIKKSFGSHTAEKNAKYMELMLVKEGLDKWLGSEQGLFESEMGRSEAVLAAKDIVDSVQDMLEKISKIQNEQVPALIDTIRDQIGSEQAEQFKGAISPMLVELYSALSTAREGSDTAVRQLAGEDVGQSMDMNMGGRDAGLGGDSDFDDEDMFGAEPAAAGGAVGDLDEPELGRERRGMSEGRVEMPSSSLKSVYYPDKTQAPIKKSRFAYDAQGERNFKNYPDQTSRPAGMNPDPASRTSAEECAMCESGNCEEHGMVEGETTYKNGVTTHRKTDFPGYPTDDGDDIEDANKGKRGRPRKHAVKVAKTDAEGNKLGRGRPKKDAAPVHSKMNDPFGRVPNKAPKTKLKGRTHTMAEAMDKLSQRFSRISEGINFAELLKSKHQTVDEMLSELQQDIKQFKDTGHCSELLKDCMEIKGYHGKVVADEATNPSNPFYKKQNDYNLPPAMRGHGTADYTLPDVKAHDNIERDHYRDRAGLPPLDTSLEEELSELAKLAGLSEVSRGDYIKQKDTEAEHSGKNKFQAFGQEFDTDEITEEPNEGNTFTKGLEDDDVEIGDKIPGTNAVKKVDIDESVEDTINVATNMSSNGDKNVTVTANGSQAAELLQMLRIAGLGNGQAAQDLQGQADTPIDAQVAGEEGIEVIELPAQEPEVDEAETHVDDAGANPVNAPNEKYMSMKGSTMGPGEGDSGEKAMNPDRPTKNNGDNALATPPTRAQKTLIAVSALESKLAAEYESIKKLSA